jgi:hypothetical protein
MEKIRILAKTGKGITDSLDSRRPSAYDGSLWLLEIPASLAA